jgi:uncharacterized membrane protein
VCSLPASARFWLENFLFLTSTAAVLLLLLKREFTLNFFCETQ